MLAHSAGTLVTLELLRANPAIISRAILHEPAVTNEGAGLGAAPVLLEMIAAGKVSRALRAFLGAIGDSDPEAPKLTEAEAKHALRNGRSFMANEYGITMTCVPDWDSVRASRTVNAVLLGELSIGKPKQAPSANVSAVLTNVLKTSRLRLRSRRLPTHKNVAAFTCLPASARCYPCNIWNPSLPCETIERAPYAQ